MRPRAEITFGFLRIILTGMLGGVTGGAISGVVTRYVFSGAVVSFAHFLTLGASAGDAFGGIGLLVYNYHMLSRAA